MGKLAALFAFLACSAAAASDDAAIQNTFVKPWIQALRSKDPAKIARFRHPQVQACVNEGSKLFFDYLMNNELNLAVTGPYQVLSLKPATGPGPLLMLPADGFAYPVQPKYELQVQFNQANLTVLRLLAPSSGGWFEVFPCPNEKGVAFVREKMDARAEQHKNAERLAAEINEPLLGELKEMLARGRKIDAVKKYQQAGDGDLTTAVLVIEELQKSGR